MAQPTTYDRQFNFQNQQSLTPTDPLPADELDAELNAIKVTLDELLNNIALIQRDDGALANESVGRDTLDSSVSLGFGAPTKWAPNTRYVEGFDTVFYLLKFYSCITTHVSDLAQDGFPNDAAYWEEIADFSASAVGGLGSLAAQDADDVEITGGVMSGVVVTVGTPTQNGHAAPKTYVDTADTTLSDSITTLAATLRGELNAPSGTRMVFQQTSAPTGWTKDATHNDKALRLVSGSVSSGGTLSFSTVFGKAGTDGSTLTQANLPSGITLTTNISDSRSWAIANCEAPSSISPAGGAPVNVFRHNTSGSPSYAVSVSGSISGSTPLGGSGTAHSHGMDIRVQYVDAIIAQKD